MGEQEQSAGAKAASDVEATTPADLPIVIRDLDREQQTQDSAPGSSDKADAKSAGFSLPKFSLPNFSLPNLAGPSLSHVLTALVAGMVGAGGVGLVAGSGGSSTNRDAAGQIGIVLEQARKSEDVLRTEIAARAPQAGLDALATRISEIEQGLALTSEGASIFTPLRQRLAALETVTASDTSPPTTDDVARALASIEARLALLENRQASTLVTAAGTGATGMSAEADTALRALASEVEALKRAAPAMAARAFDQGRSVKAAFAVAEVDRLAATNQPFPAAANALLEALPDDPSARALAVIARTGAPTRLQLRQMFEGLEGALKKTAKAEAPKSGVFGLFAKKPGPDDPRVIVETIGQRVAVNDLAGAAQIAARARGATASHLKDWLVGARARLELESRLFALRGTLERKGG